MSDDLSKYEVLAENLRHGRGYYGAADDITELVAMVRQERALARKDADIIGRLNSRAQSAEKERDEARDLTWFWEIVDRGGLNNVCSDERGALAEFVRVAKRADAAEAENAKLREALHEVQKICDMHTDKCNEAVKERDKEIVKLREGLKEIEQCAHGIMPIYENMNQLRTTIIGLQDARWTRLYAILAAARVALGKE